MARSRRAAVTRRAGAAIVVVALTRALALGQEPTPTPPASKGAAPPDAGPRKAVTLTIEVRTVDPGKKTATGPAPNAMVRIEGTEDPLATNAQGRARFSGISSAKVTVQIMVVGADLCRLPDIAITHHDQVVKVLVDTSPNKERCRRLE